MANQSKLEKYFNSYHYRNNPIPHDQEGVWRVRGEDPNCDYSGPHYMPELGIYSGKFIDVATLAVELPKFWTWGAGGEINPVVVKPIDSQEAVRLKNLREEKERLEKRLAEIKKEGV